MYLWNLQAKWPHSLFNGNVRTMLLIFCNSQRLYTAKCVWIWQDQLWRVVQWLRQHASTSGDMDLIPFQRNWNPISSAVQQKKKKKRIPVGLVIKGDTPLTKRAPCAQSEVSFDPVPPTTTPTHKTCQHEFFCFPWNCLYQILSVYRALEVLRGKMIIMRRMMAITEEKEHKTRNECHRGRYTYLKKKKKRHKEV